MTGQARLVPKRRFKEYQNTSAWEQRKLGEIVDFLDEKRKPLESGVRESGPYPYYGASGIIDYVKDYLFNEELILLSEDGANIIDRNYRVCFIARGKYWVNNHAHVLKSKENYCNGFICESLERLDYTRYNTGTAQPKLNKEVCSNITILVPKIEEQKCISMFLDKLDNLITLHQRKLEKTKALKAAYLSEMFPAEGECVPKRRFSGFTDAWEQRKLGDISDVTKLAGFEFTEYVTYSDKGTIIALRGLNVKNGKIVLDDVKYIDKSDFSKLNRSKLLKNDILFTYVGTVGEVAIIPEDNKYYLAPNVARIRLEKEVDPQFVIQMMGNKTYYDKVIFPLIATSSQPALSMENVRKFILKLPKIEEQTQIGTFFAELDNLITLHQRKLEKLQSIKKAYLNEMFV